MTTFATPAATTTAPTTGSLAVAGLAATAAASVATTLVAAAGSAVGIGLDTPDGPIPVTGFGVLTAIFSVVGLVIAAAIRRWARRPRRTFVVTTSVLTALSLVPDIMLDVPTATRLLMMATHLVAAAIVVPAVARRLRA